MPWFTRHHRRVSLTPPVSAETETTRVCPTTGRMPIPHSTPPPSQETALARHPASTASGPCQRCGACCAFYLVSFPNNEAVDNELFDLSLPLGETRRFMKGTKARHPRCLALLGTIGSHVACRIYEHRPSTCREFRRSWEDNTGNILCDRARGVFGLEPFSQY